jgi:hypothetical protein
MATKKSIPPGPPMDLANMREQGVHSLAVYCLNPRCLHRSVLNVDSYPATKLVQSSGQRWCAQSAARSAPMLGQTGKKRARSKTAAARMQCRVVSDGALARR